MDINYIAGIADLIRFYNSLLWGLFNKSVERSAMCFMGIFQCFILYIETSN